MKRIKMDTLIKQLVIVLLVILSIASEFAPVAAGGGDSE